MLIKMLFCWNPTIQNRLEWGENCPELITNIWTIYNTICQLTSYLHRVENDVEIVEDQGANTSPYCEGSKHPTDT